MTEEIAPEQTTENGVDAQVHAIVQRLDVRSKRRDMAITESRSIVRLSANAVRALQRGEAEAAHGLLATARAQLESMMAQIASEPELTTAGYVQDAMREYAEGTITAALTAGASIPTVESLGVTDTAYLNALAEAASELRRHVLDLLRHGLIQEAEHLLDSMDGVYAALLLVDFPDAMTGGLRRSVDALRAVLERTRGDVTNAVGQARLATELARTRSLLDRS